MKLAEVLVSLRNRHLAQKKNYGKRNLEKSHMLTNTRNCERLELCRQLYAYVISTSLPEWEYFDRLIFVAQSVQPEFVSRQM
jgi:hypothetical protein